MGSLSLLRCHGICIPRDRRVVSCRLAKPKLSTVAVLGAHTTVYIYILNILLYIFIY